MLITQINQPKPEISERLAKIHKEVLAESFLSSLGLPFLKLLYPILLSNKKNVVLVANDKNEIVGFLVATIDNNNLLKSVVSLRNLLSLLPTLVPVFITHPPFLLALGKWSLTQKQHSPSAELQFIAILPKYQGKGLGTKMVIVLNNLFQKRGVKSYLVSTKSNNFLSNGFYKRLGYKLAFREKVFNDNMNYYLFNLKAHET